MRRSLVAVHVVALAAWLGALAFSAALAKTLFEIARPVCPACLEGTLEDAQVACATCGARHHEHCAPKGCGLDHEGDHQLRPIGEPRAERARQGTATWTRVLLTGRPGVAPEKRLLWRLEAGSDALEAARGEVPGAVFELPRATVGDALARSFQLARFIGLAMGIVALVSTILTPPGGALRFVRAGAIALALGVAAMGVAAGHEVGTKRLVREVGSGLAPEARAVAKDDFTKTHVLANVLGLVEGALVLVAFAVATLKRDGPPEPAAVSPRT